MAADTKFSASFGLPEMIKAQAIAMCASGSLGSNEIAAPRRCVRLFRYRSNEHPCMSDEIERGGMVLRDLKVGC